MFASNTRMIARSLRSGSSAMLSSAAKDYSFNPSIEVKNVIKSITANVGNEANAVGADEVVHALRNNIKNLKTKNASIDVISVSRAVCKNKWDYRVDIEFKTLDGMKLFSADADSKKIFDEAVSKISNYGKDVKTQGFVFNRTPIIVAKGKGETSE